MKLSELQPKNTLRLSDLQNAGTPEPRGQIAAQIGDMLDPNTARDTVFVGKNTQSPGIKQITTDDGTLLTTNPEKAKLYKKTPTDNRRASVLGYNQSKNDVLKSGKQPLVVVVTDQKGNRIFEELTTDKNTAILKYMKDGYSPQAGYKITVESPVDTQKTRTDLEYLDKLILQRDMIISPVVYMTEFY